MSASTAGRQTMSVRTTGVAMGANEFTLSLSDGREIIVPYRLDTDETIMRGNQQKDTEK